MVPLSDGVDEMATYLGRTLDTQERITASTHLFQSANMARVWTRRAGFDDAMNFVDSPLMSIIVSRAVRSMTNPTDLSQWSAAGVSQRPGRVGWTLAEMKVLDDYRARAGSLS